MCIRDSNKPEYHYGLTDRIRDFASFSFWFYPTLAHFPFLFPSSLLSLQLPPPVFSCCRILGFPLCTCSVLAFSDFCIRPSSFHDRLISVFCSLLDSDTRNSLCLYYNSWLNPVSYTHLDVYKRQLCMCSQCGL